MIKIKHPQYKKNHFPQSSSYCLQSRVPYEEIALGEGRNHWHMLLQTPWSSQAAVVPSQLNKPSLDADSPANNHPLSSLPFLGEVIEQVITQQLQRHLDAISFMGPCQSGSPPGHSMETVLMAWVDDLYLEINRRNWKLYLVDLTRSFRSCGYI